MGVARRLVGGLIGTKLYVPACQMVADFEGGVGEFSLGSPAAADDDLIAATIDGDAVADTVEAYSWTSDAYYGRTLQVKVSADPGAATSVVDIHGYDWLGQPMVERFTTANGSTAIQYDKKAFYRTTKSVIITAATNAITLKVGTAFRVGLPYKCDVNWARENGVFVNVTKRDTRFYFDADSTETIAGYSHWHRATFPGYVKTLIATPHGGGSTNDPVITVELGGTAIVGLTVTSDNSDVAGLIATDTPTTVGYNANNRFATGDLIEIVSAAAASAHGQQVILELTPTQVILGDTTDAATRTTGDPRGTYEPLSVPAGNEIIVGLMPDKSVNTSGNGGLHGIAQYY